MSGGDLPEGFDMNLKRAVEPQKAHRKQENQKLIFVPHVAICRY
jgi:hypothetical protein